MVLSVPLSVKLIGRDDENPLNASDPSIVCDGVQIVNDQSSEAFISMIEELKEFSQTGTNVKKKGHREKHLYGRSAPGFFAARPVRRNDYINNTAAMQAYWKEWKLGEEESMGLGDPT